MNLLYLGTAAAEGIPALFCDCPTCRRALSGKSPARKRSGALVDHTVMLDFSPDAYCQMLALRQPLAHIKSLFITHTHSDHFAHWDLGLRKPPFAHVPPDAPTLTVYGNAAAGKLLDKQLCAGLAFRRIRPFQTVKAGGYAVTALKAVHAAEEEALFYLVEKNGQSLLYAHDTDEFTEEDMAFLAGRKIDIISLDATNGTLDMDYIGHMGIRDCVRMRDRLIGNGAACADTRFVLNHFSHNGFTSDEEVKALAGSFIIAYDGLTIS